jgi:hypothetical protein
MPVSRRNFLGNAAALAMLASLLSPEDLHALEQAGQDAAGDSAAPHDSPGFWGGFYDTVNPSSPEYGQKGATRGADSLVDPKLETQYLQYNSSAKKLRYATSVDKDELLDHDGDVAVSILMNQFRPSSDDAKHKSASQLRVDTTQNHPFMNILAPLAWTAMASLQPDKAGKIPSLDQLGFKSDQVMTASSHILLTKGSGKIAVNISRAPRNSAFLKVLGAMISGAKMVAPFVGLPAVSVPAMAMVSQAFAYWEDRTQFLLNGNLVNGYATKQAMDDPEIKSPAIGLLPGDYVVVAKKDTEKLEAAISKLHIYQGYLVHEDTDLSQITVDKAKDDPKVPDITYATVKVGVTAMNTSLGGPNKKDEPESGAAAKKKKKASGSEKQ